MQYFSKKKAFTYGISTKLVLFIKKIRWHYNTNETQTISDTGTKMK